MVYNNSDSISFEDVKSNLLSKDKFDNDIHADFAKGLVVRGKRIEKENSNRIKNRSKCRNPLASKAYNYYSKLGHIVANCWKLQNKREKKEDSSHEPAEVSFAESDSDGDILFASSTERWSISN